MRRILITGGSGFIGTNLIERLSQDAVSIMNIDIQKPVVESQEQFWKEVNILDHERLMQTSVAFNPEIIIHLAAVTDLDGTDLEYYKTNIEGTKHVIEIAKKTPALSKVIFTSSMYVCKPGFIPPDYDTYRPHTVYGESKMKGELLVKDIKEAAFEWTIVRPTSIWGPWFKIPYIDFFKIVYQRKYFDFGKACRKTYGYVSNTVEQIITLMDAKGTHQKTYYLGDDPATHISEWANEISIEMGNGPIRKVPYSLLRGAALVGDTLSFMKVPFPLTSFRLKNMTTNNVLPLKDLYSITGKPAVSRVEGVKSTLKWLKEHRAYQIS